MIGLIALALSACGPAGYINQVTFKADSAVAAAQAAEADKYSPYWYTLAVEYLHKAREEAASADFQAANRFGRKAHRAAIEARKQAVGRAANPDDRSWMPPSGELPTDDDAGQGGLAPAMQGEGAP